MEFFSIETSKHKSSIARFICSGVVTEEENDTVPILEARST